MLPLYEERWFKIAGLVLVCALVLLFAWMVLAF